MAHLVGTVPAAQRGRAMSVFQAVIGIGLLLGPLVGGLMLATAGFRAPLFAYGAICLASAPLCLRAMRRAHVTSSDLDDAVPAEDPVTGPARPAWSRLRPLFADSAYRAALAGSATGFFVSGGLQTLIPGFWTDVLKGSKGTVGIPFTVLALASLVVIWHAGSLSDRRGRKAVLVPALLGTGVVTSLMGLSEAALALLVLTAALGITTGYARPGPTSIVADVAPPDARGVAVAGYRTAADVGALVGTIVVGVIAEVIGYWAAFVAIGAFALVAAVLAMTARETAPSRTVAEPARA
jgi:MFS family permease